MIARPRVRGRLPGARPTPSLVIEWGGGRLVRLYLDPPLCTTNQFNASRLQIAK